MNEKYGECRGSGVLLREGGEWRIAQYNLTVPIPNDLMGRCGEADQSHAEEVTVETDSRSPTLAPCASTTTACAPGIIALHEAITDAHGQHGTPLQLTAPGFGRDHRSPHHRPAHR